MEWCTLHSVSELHLSISSIYNWSPPHINLDSIYWGPIFVDVFISSRALMWFFLQDVVQMWDHAMWPNCAGRREKSSAVHTNAHHVVNLSHDSNIFHSIHIVNCIWYDIQSYALLVTVQIPCFQEVSVHWIASNWAFRGLRTIIEVTMCNFPLSLRIPLVRESYKPAPIGIIELDNNLYIVFWL